MAKYFHKISQTLIYIFAIIGLVLSLAFVTSKLGLTKGSSFLDNKYNYFDKSRFLKDNASLLWINTGEYWSLKETLKKEQSAIQKAEEETGIKSRIIVSMLFVEQMRLYNSERELFKKVFEPLKILGVQSQFSWGVLGLKQDTLIQIERNLKISTSTYYLGKEFENILDFKTQNIDSERFDRVTDSHNQYYSYLYTALYIKQIERQWTAAGYDISNRPEILATLYNIGFTHSNPNKDPQVGGAEIDIQNEKYSFGRLAYEFYYSNELVDIFPK